MVPRPDVLLAVRIPARSGKLDAEALVSRVVRFASMTTSTGSVRLVDVTVLGS